MMFRAIFGAGLVAVALNFALLLGIVWVLSHGATVGNTHYKLGWSEDRGIELIEREVK